MNFDKLEQAIIRYRESLARFRDDREALRALGVTDLPGDAPRCLNPHFPPGNLPGEPTNEMIAAAYEKWVFTPVGNAESLRPILRAALAAAPRVEVPEVTDEDVDEAYRAWSGHAGNERESTKESLRVFRARLIARMGAKS